MILQEISRRSVQVIRVQKQMIVKISAEFLDIVYSVYSIKETIG